MTTKRLLLLLAIAALIAVFFALDLRHVLAFDTLKRQQVAIAAYRDAHPLLASALYAALYVTVTALSLPGAAVLTITGGAIFGLLWGTVLVSFASTLGATLAFLAARFLFRDAVQARFRERVKAVDAGIARDGVFYLVTLRLVPVFPFFVINLLMGLTAMPALTFAGVSQIGMLPGTLVYVNAGTQLAQIESVEGIMSPPLLLAFALLGLFPLLARWLVRLADGRKVYAAWSKPERFDRNLIVIGAGAAGLMSAYIGAAAKAKVTLVEKGRMGGDCLNTGCVPSKALIRTARLLAQIRRAPHYGVRSATADFDFATAMERVQQVVQTIAPHDSVERYTALGVEVIRGAATVRTPWTVAVETEHGTQTLTTRNIVIAAGARPLVPPIPGIEQVGYLTSDTVWNLRVLPRRLVVLGGGPIGCELAQCFARFGSRVTQIEMLPRLLAREDPEVSEVIATRLRQEGVDLRLGHEVRRCQSREGEKLLITVHQGNEERIPFDELLVAVGRIANTEGYGLDELGIPTTAERTVEVNEFLQTRYPNIYACGDVAGPLQFTHVAAHQAWYAVVNALAGPLVRFRVDDSVTPWATFTDPEVARVGLNETAAQAQGLPYEVSRYGIDDQDRAIIDGSAQGFVKVLTRPGKDKVLGVTIVGEHAGELVAEFVMAMKHGIGLNQILRTMHVYPTWAEASQHAAGVWKRAHAPRRLLHWVERYHAWRRG